MKQDIQIKHFSAAGELVEVYELFLTNCFEVPSLDQLSESAIIGSVTSLVRGTDQTTLVHSRLYQEFDRGLDSPLIYTYRSLCNEWLESLVETYNIDRWAFQRFPSARIHFPDNISVFEFHRDSDYNHPLGELNHFLALTKANGTASLHIEQDLGWNNYKPLELDKGMSAIINTSIFKHGDYINKEGYTRVSLDFRAIPVEALECGDPLKSLTKHRVFDCDDYFISSTELFGE